MKTTVMKGSQSRNEKRIKGKRNSVRRNDQPREMQKNEFKNGRKNMQGNQMMQNNLQGNNKNNRQGNNKNNEKTNDNKFNINKGRFTLSPTFTPTRSPTQFPTPQSTRRPTSPPTFAPSQIPSIISSSSPSINYDIRIPIIIPAENSISPTISPSHIDVSDSSSDIIATMPPTAAMTTSSPTVSPIVFMRFSILMSEEYQNIRAEDVLSNNDEGLVLNLLQSITISVCRSTDYKVVTTVNPDRDLCEIIQKRRKLRSELPSSFTHFPFSTTNTRRLEEKEDIIDGVFAVLSFDPLSSVESAFDMSMGNTTFLEIVLRSEVEEIGPFYTRMSDMSFGTKTPISMIESTVQEVLDDSILDGSFLMNVQSQEDEDDSKIIGVSTLGDEIDMFFPFETAWNETNNTFNIQSIEENEYIVTPLHSTRIAGIVLMFCTFSFTFVLFSAGKRRKKKNEWIQADESLLEENGETLRLSSEDAVTAMLNVGRNTTEEMRYSQVNEENVDPNEAINLSSTWEVMIGSENTMIDHYEQVRID